MNGYVKTRRGIVDHITSGTLNAVEFAIFHLLVLLADTSTGSHTINSAVLRSCYFPEMARDTAQRSLVSLEEKRFIFRLNPASSKRAYRYWVDKFEATTGPNAKRRTDLSQVFESKNISDLKWVDVAAEIQAEVQTGIPTGIPTSYGERRKKKEDKGGSNCNPLFSELSEIWNQHCGSLPKIQKLSASRRKKLATRISEAETSEAYLADFTQAVKLCATTPFLSGKNDRQWTADFDWLVENDGNLAKVIEGKYGKPVGCSTNRSQPSYQDPNTLYDNLKSAPRRTA
jgi:hypothetical protein